MIGCHLWVPFWDQGFVYQKDRFTSCAARYIMYDYGWQVTGPGGPGCWFFVPWLTVMFIFFRWLGGLTFVKEVWPQVASVMSNHGKTISNYKIWWQIRKVKGHNLYRWQQLNIQIGGDIFTVFRRSNGNEPKHNLRIQSNRTTISMWHQYDTNTISVTKIPFTANKTYLFIA